MKWSTYWWGIDFIAENESDHALLEQLRESLDKPPEDSYDDASCELECDCGEWILTVSR